MNLLIVISAKYLIYVLIVASLVFLLSRENELRKKIAFVAILAVPFAYIIGKILSLFYYSTRPFVSGHYTPLISHAANNGFPSDHALLSFTIASIIFMFNRKLGFGFFLVGAAISLARILAGIHSPIDILGGLLVGIVASFLANFLIKKWQK